MLAAFDRHRTGIATLSRQFHVRELDVFGSAARVTDLDPGRSDVDLLVDYEPDDTPPSLTDFLALRDALAALLGRPADLVMASAVRNPYVRASINRSRQRLYGA